MTTVKKTEVKKAARDVRKYIAETLSYLETHDLSNAYRTAELAQRAAFDVKDLIKNGGDYNGQPSEY